MSNSLVRVSLLTGIVAMLSACGDASVIDAGGATPPPAPGTQVPAILTLLASSPQLPSGATDPANGVTLSAVVKDANNVVIPGADVTFRSVDAGSDLTVTSATTDASGTATAVLDIGSNKANRDITVRATSGTATDLVTVRVVGTTLTLAGPTSGQFNTAASYVATLLDSNGAGIFQEQLTFSSPGGTSSPTTQTSDASGQGTVNFTPTTTAASTTLSVTGLGQTASVTIALSQDSFAFTAPAAGAELNVGAPQTVSVTWTRSGVGVAGATITFSATRGTLSASSAVTNASGVATVTINSAQAGVSTISASGNDGTITATATRTVEFVATTPANISLQPDPATISVGNTSTLRAIVRDAASNFVKNQTVNFTIDQGPGSLSAASAITDSQGTAIVTYTATATSAAGGVVVTATVAGTAVTDSANITVGGSALRLVLGTGNSMSELSTTLYSVPYSVIVTDANGSAVPGKTVNLSLHALDYRKGTSCKDATTGVWYRADLACAPTPIVCTNEDLLSPDPNLRLDGILNDPVNEDIDADNHLDPENVGSVPSSVTTDANGIANLNVVYPQDRAYWVQVRLRASVGSVDGTESVEEVFFLLPGTAADFSGTSAPPGVDSPYGIVQDCTNPG